MDAATITPVLERDAQRRSPCRMIPAINWTEIHIDRRDAEDNLVLNLPPEESLCLIDFDIAGDPPYECNWLPEPESCGLSCRYQVGVYSQEHFYMAPAAWANDSPVEKCDRLKVEAVWAERFLILKGPSKNNFQV